MSSPIKSEASDMPTVHVAEEEQPFSSSPPEKKKKEEHKGPSMWRLQTFIPVVLFIIVLVAIAFIGVDAAHEVKEHKKRQIGAAQGYVSSGVVTLTTTFNASSKVDLESISRIRGKVDDVTDAGKYGSLFELADTSLRSGDVVAVVKHLVTIQEEMLFDGASKESVVELSSLGTLWGVSKKMMESMLEAEVWQAGKTKIKQLYLTAENYATFDDIATSSLFPSRIQDQLAAFDTANTIKTSELATAVKVSSTPISTTKYEYIDKEFEAIGVALQHAAEKLDSLHKDGAELERSRYFTSLTILLLIFIVGSIGTVLAIVLLRSENISLVEQSQINSDFNCNDIRVKVGSRTLLGVDRVLEAIAVLAPSALGERAGQIERRLYQAVGPLSLLRPFAPSICFGQFRAASTLRGPSDNWQAAGAIINHDRGLKKRATALLYIGLRKLNEPDADLSEMNRYLQIIVRCVAHFRGNIIQTASNCIMAVFSRATIDEDEEEERLEDGEVLATHCAFAILSLTQEEPEMEHIPVSMAVASNLTLQGMLNYYVSTQYGLVSEAVLSAIEIEPLNDLHGTSILTDVTTNDLLGDRFLTRPVHYIPGRGSVYSVMMEEPAEDHPYREEVLKEQEKVREKVGHWTKSWDKYELLVSTEKPSFEMLDEAFKDLEAYKLIALGSEEDRAFSLAMANIKKIEAANHYNLASTVDED